MIFKQCVGEEYTFLFTILKKCILLFLVFTYFSPDTVTLRYLSLISSLEYFEYRYFHIDNSHSLACYITLYLLTLSRAWQGSDWHFLSLGNPITITAVGEDIPRQHPMWGTYALTMSLSCFWETFHQVRGSRHFYKLPSGSRNITTPLVYCILYLLYTEVTH